MALAYVDMSSVIEAQVKINEKEKCVIGIEKKKNVVILQQMAIYKYNQVSKFQIGDYLFQYILVNLVFE